MSTPPRLVLAAGLLALGCFPGKVVGTSDTTSVGDSTGVETTSDGTEATTGESSTGDGDGDSESSETGEETFETAFVPDDDFAACGQCDFFLQDCPEDEKCSPVAIAGLCGLLSCKPVIADLPPGEPCSIVEGVDDCDASSWCYPGQHRPDGPSICVEFCQGTADNSSCSSRDQVCVVDRIVYQGPIGCRPRCNPSMPDDCDPSEMCTLGNNDQPDFGCVPDGAVLATGEPCKFNQECIAGLCVAAEDLSECADNRCCASFCDLLAPDCPVATECVSIELADNPESTVGVCRLPD